MKKYVALLLAMTMMLALCGCGKSEETTKAETAISAIGEVTTDSGEAILAAKKAYDKLSDADKKNVENYGVLASALEDYYSIMKKDMCDTLVALHGDCNYCAMTVCAVWEQSGASNFYTYYEPITLINSKEDLDVIGHAATVVLAMVFCPEETTGIKVSEKGKSYLVAVCEHFNSARNSLEGNCAYVKRSLSVMKELYADTHAAEIDDLWQWYTDAALYADFAREPSGSFASYQADYKEYDSTLNRYEKSLT